MGLTLHLRCRSFDLTRFYHTSLIQMLLSPIVVVYVNPSIAYLRYDENALRRWQKLCARESDDVCYGRGVPHFFDSSSHEGLYTPPEQPIARKIESATR